MHLVQAKLKHEKSLIKGKAQPMHTPATSACRSIRPRGPLTLNFEKYTKQALHQSRFCSAHPCSQRIGSFGSTWCHDGIEVLMDERPDQHDSVPVAQRQCNQQLQAYLYKHSSHSSRVTTTPTYSISNIKLHYTMQGSIAAEQLCYLSFDLVSHTEGCSSAQILLLCNTPR